MKTHLSAVELRDAERTLKKQLDAYSEQLRELERNTLAPTGDPDGQLSDEGTDDAAFERDEAPLAVEDALVYEVQEALDRIEEGTYGICEVCERPIERERLALIAHARTCSACAAQGEGR